MRTLLTVGVSLLMGAWSLSSTAAIITVTTTNNASPGAGDVSLAQALGQARDGDEVHFNIPGSGPHYIATPAAGYPLLTNSILINGYTQPGSAPNSNGILSANNAKIQVVLDSRAGGYTVMDTFKPTAPNDDKGYEVNESAVLGIVDAPNVRIQGLSFLGVPNVGTDKAVSLYFISFARGGSGRISGCWLGVDPDAKTVAGGLNGITGFRYEGKDNAGAVTNTVLVNNLVIGVDRKSTNAVQQFNVILGMPGSPIVVEGDNTRIAGNFIMVLPDGLHDFDVALDPTLQGQFQGAIAIGRGGNNTLIGTDGDGVNDENERNIFGGMLPRASGGYDHLIEFYSQNPGTNVVLAGNYVGIGIDGKTRFTNGVPVLNASGDSAQYRIGSDFNGVSDAAEGNLIANNWPASLFPPADFGTVPEALSFFDQLSAGTSVSLRGNSLINNLPFPASPLRDNSSFLQTYYSKVLPDPTVLAPTLSSSSTHTRLKGTVPVPDSNAYSSSVVDVYVADPEGIATGTAAAVPELQQGFVQGLKYLGSFTVPAALGTNTAAFDADITKMAVPAGTQLTVTANYIPGIPVTGEPGTFTSVVRNDDGSITMTWASGSLESAPTVLGDWTPESTTGNTFTTTPSEPMEFFRMVGGGDTTPGAPGTPMTSPFSNVVQVQ